MKNYKEKISRDEDDELYFANGNLVLTSCTARNTRSTSLATNIRNFILRHELSSQVSTLR